jgi:hypothetical protein
MQKSNSPGQPFINAINQTRAAIVSAAERRGERGVLIAQAIHLLRGNVVSCARSIMASGVADRLAALCEYMSSRLEYAEIHGVDAPLTEVIRLLDDLRRASPSLDHTGPQRVVVAERAGAHHGG